MTAEEKEKQESGFVRTQRANNLRSTEEHGISWAPPPLLPDPPELDGWVHRWIRTSTLGKSDDANVSYRRREGWELVSADDADYAEIVEVLNFGGRKKGGNIETGGQVLCRMPASRARAREKFFQDKAVGQVEAVNKRLVGQGDPAVGLRFSVEELKQQKSKTR